MRPRNLQEDLEAKAWQIENAISEAQGKIEEIKALQASCAEIRAELDLARLREELEEKQSQETMRAIGGYIPQASEYNQLAPYQVGNHEPAQSNDVGALEAALETVEGWIGSEAPPPSRRPLRETKFGKITVRQ